MFYNGKKERSEREVIKLSDAYITQDAEVSLELLVDVLNINVGHNKELLGPCKTLGGYSEYDQEEHIRLKREDAFEDGSKAHLISRI